MLAGVFLQQRGRRGARAAAPGLSATMGLFTVQLAAAALARARLASTRSSRARLRPAVLTSPGRQALASAGAASCAQC